MVEFVKTNVHSANRLSDIFTTSFGALKLLSIDITILSIVMKNSGYYLKNKPENPNKKISFYILTRLSLIIDGYIRSFLQEYELNVKK